jgi:hypothetical protein
MLCGNHMNTVLWENWKNGQKNLPFFNQYTNFEFVID